MPLQNGRLNLQSSPLRCIPYGNLSWKKNTKHRNNYHEVQWTLTRMKRRSVQEFNTLNKSSTLILQFYLQTPPLWNALITKYKHKITTFSINNVTMMHCEKNRNRIEILKFRVSEFRSTWNKWAYRIILNSDPNQRNSSQYMFKSDELIEKHNNFKVLGRTDVQHEAIMCQKVAYTKTGHKMAHFIIK